MSLYRKQMCMMEINYNKYYSLMKLSYKKYEKKVLAFGGCVAEDATLCNQYGIDAFFPILRTVTTLKEAMDFNHAKENLSAAVEQVFRLIQSFK